MLSVIGTARMNPALLQARRPVRFGNDAPANPPAAKPDPYTTYVDGLEGIVGGETAIGHIDPVAISLVYRGYEIRDLAKNANFEETSYLLLNGELPTADQAKAFDQKIRAQRNLPAPVVKAIRDIYKVNRNANPMAVLRTAVSMLSEFDPKANDISHDANIEKSISLMAKIPTIITTAHRISQGLKPIAPNSQLNQAENFFYMLNGKKPDPDVARIFDKTMILYAEHGFNASTYSARVTSSTLTDYYSAITAGIGTLKGPLHGGANEEAMKMLQRIGTLENVEPYLAEAFKNKEKIMGFGHRVYKNGDTRAPILKDMAKELAQKQGNFKWYDIANKVEEVMAREMAKKGKKLPPNVDFPTSYLYYMMDIPIQLYTPIFAAARISGWSAHVIEQLDNNRLIRPKALYTGPSLRTYKPVNQR